MASRTCCPKPVGARSAVSPWISRRSSQVAPSDLFVQIDRGKDANAGLTVSAGVMGGGTADQIIGDAPLVGVDPLDDTGPA
ncbi:hypothetical protein ABLN55_005475 [Escherichia coli]